MSLTKNFKPFDKEQVLKYISGIDISMQDDMVITKYFGVTKKCTKVSKRYEIFDIRSFMIQKIDEITKNFDISYYRLVVKSGIQYLVLISDAVEINGVNFYKSFYILNSSDKSRSLSLNMGLYQDSSDTYFILSVSNMSLFTKHLTGVTEKAESISESIKGESFDEQIASIQSIVGQKVMLSKVREIIVDEDFQINHKKFDAFKNLIRSSLKLTSSQDSFLKTPSEKIVFDSSNDLSIDAFLVFNLYMLIFKNQDAHIVKKETERIFKITKCFVRQEKLKDLLLEL